MEHFSWFNLIGLGKYDHILGAVLVVILLVLAGLRIKKILSTRDNTLPDDKLSVKSVFEILTLDFLLGLLTGILGSQEKARKYLPLLGTAFIFILFSNLLGLIPGFLPPTGNLNTPVACAIVVFLMYNYYGFREHGIGYLKHFAGPLIYMAPLIFVVEVISHLVRPVSLSLRLFLNMTADHMLLGLSFFIPILLPVGSIALGVFVSLIQAFVFVVLSAIYITLAVAHEH